MEEIINVGLYGGKSIFGGRETPLEASVISCDKHKSCSYFKNGQCMNIRSFLSANCKHGSVQTVKGYTSRAKKYHQFKSEWKNHEKYGKLTHPPTKLGLIEDDVVFPYAFVRIQSDKEGNLQVLDPSFGNSVSFIKREAFTIELIYKLCTFRPQAMLGGEITTYQNETIPLFLTHLEEVLPNLFEEFTTKYPHFVKKIDYIGRKAILKTVKPSTVYYRSKSYSDLNQEWEWDGELLHYKKGHVSNFHITNDYEIAEIVIRPSDKATIKITDNEQVDKSTVFVD